MKRRLRRGFTLIEIMMAMGLFGLVFGSIAYLLISAMNARRDAVVLSQSVLLAQKKMDEIKTILKEETEKGEIDGVSDYRFSYSIVEEEKNFLEEVGGAGFLEDAGIDLGDDESVPREFVTAGIIKVLHYQVVITHKSGLTYALDYYRNAGK